MQYFVKNTIQFLFCLLLITSVGSCSEEIVDPTVDSNPDDGGQTPVDNTPPAFTGDLNALFVGHSGMNMIVDDYVRILAEQNEAINSLSTDQVTNESISLVGKMDREYISDLFDGDPTHQYNFAVLTEQWEYQNYNPNVYGQDTNGALDGCPGEDYQVPALWETPAEDWAPIPYYLQQYADALECGNSESVTYYYQTWSLGYNEVENGLTRTSNPDFQRPTISEIEQILTGSGELSPNLPLADRIEFEGVKWQYFVRSTNRSHIVFIPAAFVMARLMREIEAGVVPGFEAVRNTGGLKADGVLAWGDFLFYQDEYHLGTVGHYLMSLVIYASVFQTSPEGLEIGSGQFMISEWFPENQYPLEGITNETYESLLTEAGAEGIYDLRGYNGLDYIHDDLRLYLQRMVWDVVQNDSNY